MDLNTPCCNTKYHWMLICCWRITTLWPEALITCTSSVFPSQKSNDVQTPLTLFQWMGIWPQDVHWLYIMYSYRTSCISAPQWLLIYIYLILKLRYCSLKFCSHQRCLYDLFKDRHRLKYGYSVKNLHSLESIELK